LRNHTNKSATFEPIGSTNIVEVLENEQIKIYPNPTTGIIYIRSEKKILQIQIINAVGNTVYEQSNVGTEATIDISFAPHGTYIIRLKTDEKIITKTIIKI
jgi:hypothetical protein